jgi:uncharacterized protein (TIGR02646 family)
MNNFADSAAISALNKLRHAVINKKITVTNALAVYVKPKKNTPSDTTLILSEEEKDSLITLHEEVKKRLKIQIKHRCAYCKRVMGQHGMSWHIEHIHSKSKHPHLMFTMNNLTYACLDCNFVKNNEVDSKNTPFDIIHPSHPGFIYSQHIHFLHISTDSLHFLKYVPLSPEGTNTYIKLKFESLESLELLASLNGSTRHLVDRIDDQLAQQPDSTKLTEFLHNMKMKLSTR